MEPEKPQDSLASVNRRAVAALIDCAVLLLVGVALLLAAGDRLVAMGPFGRFIGLPFAVAYLAIGGSRWMQGQTAGKAFLGLRLVGADGRPPGVASVAVRSLVLVLPWFVAGLALDPRSRFAAPWLWAGSLLWGVAVASAYLYATASTTRQFLHDLLVGTFVVHERATGVPARVIPRPMHAIVAVGLLIVTALAMRPPRPPDGPAHPIDAALFGLPGVTGVQWTFSRTLGADPQIRTVRLHMTTTTDETDWSSLRRRAGAAVLTYFPEATQGSQLEVKTQHRMDVGLFSWTFGESEIHSPEEWRAATERERAALLPPSKR